MAFLSKRSGTMSAAGLENGSGKLEAIPCSDDSMDTFANLSRMRTDALQAVPPRRYRAHDWVESVILLWADSSRLSRLILPVAERWKLPSGVLVVLMTTGPPRSRPVKFSILIFESSKAS